MRAVDLVQESIIKYRSNINPPYNRQDLISIGATIFILLVVPLTVIAAISSRPFGQRAQTPTKVTREDKVTRVRNLTEEISSFGRAVKDDSKRKSKVSGRLVPLTKQRKTYLLDLFEAEPQIAAESLLPDDILAAVRSVPNVEVEKKMTLSGTYLEFHTDDFKNRKVKFYPQLKTKDGSTLNLYTNGRMPNIKSGAAISFTGYQLGKKVFIATPGGMSNVTEISVLGNKTLGETIGPIKTAVITANFSDSITSIDTDKIRSIFQGDPGSDVTSFFQEVSYGKTSIVPSFYGPYTLPMTAGSGCPSGFRQVLLDAANEDINFLNFRRFIYVYNCPYGATAGSLGEYTVSTPDGPVTGAEIYIGGEGYMYRTRVYAHELGHTLANKHANFFVCLPETFIPPTNFDANNCFSAGYGDEFDTMGAPPLELLPHFSPYHKNNAGWFDLGNFPTVSDPGTHTYTLAPYEAPTTDTLALNIPRGNSGTAFTVEYRQPIGTDSWMSSTSTCKGCNITEGASIRLVYTTVGAMGGGDTQAIDNTPGSILDSSFYPTKDNRDGVLLPGKTFTDPEYGISIKAVSADPSGLTVQVTIPQSCVHSAPTYTISPSSKTTSAGETADYTVTFTNNDSSKCPTNKFKYSMTHIRGANETGFGTYFSTIANPDVFTLAPGTSTDVTLSITSPLSTPTGTYNFDLYKGAGIIYSNLVGISQTEIKGLTHQITAPTDNSPPTKPSVTAAALGSKVVDLSWSGSSDNVGVVGYKILINSRRIFIVETNTFTDVSATPNSANTYSVWAFDANGNMSEAGIATVTTPAQTDMSPPTAPTILSAQATDRSITFNWTPSTDDRGIAGYKITVAGVYLTQPVDAKTTSYTFNELPTNKLYVLHVQAFDGDGNFSNYYDWESWYTITTAFTGTSPPTQSTKLYSPAGTATKIDLAWTESTDDIKVAGYTIYRNYRPIATAPTNSFSDTNGSTSLPVGAYWYYVQAFDAEGNISAPSPSYIVPWNSAGLKPPAGYLFWNAAPTADATIPTASITTPSDGQSVSGVLTVSASASDDSGIKKVELFVDGELNSTKTTSPYTFSWDTTETWDGTHWLYVRAYDNSALNGNVGTNGVITIIVNNGGEDTTLPTVSVTAPSDGSTVSGTVDITALATDNVGVAKVEFYVDGALKSTDTSSPYLYSWDTTAETNGSHTLVAKAYDTSANTATSTTVTVTVDNTTPPKPGDINGDGVVNIFDASILASRWGTDDPDADLNGNGVVDIFDASILASNWEG